MPAKKKTAAPLFAVAPEQINEDQSPEPRVVSAEAVLATRITEKPVEAPVSDAEVNLYTPKGKYPGTPLQRGDSGDTVALIQVALGCEETDGVFCLRTEQTLRRWQSRQGLAVDGIVGSYTWTRLMS